MQVELLPIEELQPFADNPYRHPKKQIEMLKKSLETFGFTNPVLVNSDNMIVAGHARVTAARELGITEIPTIRLDLPYEKSIMYVIADNRLAELAEKDDKLIAQILKDAQAQDQDLLAMGYDNFQMDVLLQDIQEHDNRYKPGLTSTSQSVEFIKDEEVALTADTTANSIFDTRSTIICYYSGGKDSSFALIWAKKNYPDKRIIAVFSDTGYEFPGMVAHIHRVCDHLDVECKIVHPEVDIFHYWETRKRFFNMVFPECQAHLIYTPINDYVLGFDPQDVVIIDGSRGDQVRRLTRKSKTSGGLDERMRDYSYYHPCHDVDYELEQKVVHESGIPIWEGYSMGFKRSACWCCPGMNGQQAYSLSVNYPGLTKTLKKMEIKLGMKLQSKQKGLDELIKIGHTKALKKASQEANGILEAEPDKDPDDRWINIHEELSEEDMVIYNREL
jgi:3'-phosphoadenosine 5'-phosphosulfate sulfotransferase (PAPS reductase)/FAD synthetase